MRLVVGEPTADDTRDPRYSYSLTIMCNTVDMPTVSVTDENETTHGVAWRRTSRRKKKPKATVADADEDADDSRFVDNDDGDHHHDDDDDDDDDEAWDPRQRTRSKVAKKKRSGRATAPRKGCDRDNRWALGDALTGHRVAVVLPGDDGRDRCVQGTVIGRVVRRQDAHHGVHAVQFQQQNVLELVDFCSLEDWKLLQFEEP